MIRYDKIVGFPIARLDYLINAGKGSEEAALVRISVDLSGDMDENKNMELWLKICQDIFSI